jgi:DNA-binding NarL/FixJ family response regulator
MSEKRKPRGAMNQTRIVIADDDSRMLENIAAMLRTDFEIVATVSDGHSLVEAAFQFQPDVVVTDISMPKMNGIDAAETIHRLLPDIRVIFLTMHDGHGYRREAHRVGAVAYVLKSAAREELNAAVYRAMEGSV